MTDSSPNAGLSPLQKGLLLVAAIALAVSLFLLRNGGSLESPLDLLGSQDPLDDQAVPPLVWFGDDSDGETSFEGTEQQVFS